MNQQLYKSCLPSRSPSKRVFGFGYSRCYIRHRRRSIPLMLSDIEASRVDGSTPWVLVSLPIKQIRITTRSKQTGLVYWTETYGQILKLLLLALCSIIATNVGENNLPAIGTLAFQQNQQVHQIRNQKLQECYGHFCDHFIVNCNSERLDHLRPEVNRHSIYSCKSSFHRSNGRNQLCLSSSMRGCDYPINQKVRVTNCFTAGRFSGSRLPFASLGKRHQLRNKGCSKLLLSSSPPAKGGRKNNKQNKLPIRQRIKMLLNVNLRKFITAQARAWERYKALSKRAQRIIALQLLVFFFSFASVAKKAFESSGPPPPIEISYSTFLDLVEQQKQAQPQVQAMPDGSISLYPNIVNNNYVNNKVSNNVPIIRNIRIGRDRYTYRLYPNPNAVMASTTASSNTRTKGSDAKSTTKFTAASMIPLQLLSPQNSLGASVPSGSASRNSRVPGTNSNTNNNGLSPYQQRKLRRLQSSPYLTAFTRPIPASAELVNTLRENDLSFTAIPAPKASPVAVALRSVILGFYMIILWRLYKTVSGGGASGASSKGDTPGKLATEMNSNAASFDDIQGIDDAKVEVMELVDALRNPEKYAILGARAPTGLLLEGPPGTGKTMLARATAASAGVPLLYCSGSDFVEMFVGRGAARVRKLFERAEKLAPCIIFVDELDALGKSRDMGLTGMGGGFSRSNDEAEQTLNQLLACMDGLDSTRRVCVLGATNRKDVLDPALIRPGRFDRIVKLKLPDAKGREAVLRVHTKKLPGFVECVGVDPKRPNALGKGRCVDLSAVAAVTEGFSGAELEFLVNEAAIRAVRRVSAALQRNTSSVDIVPHVDCTDFEESLKSFYETRRSSRSANFADLFKKTTWPPN